MICNLKVTRII